MSGARAVRADYAVFQAITTRWNDNDVYGHINNVVFYEFLDSVVNRHLIEAGVLDFERGDQIGLVVESGCRFHAPLSYPQTLEAGLRVAKVGTSSVRYEVGLFAEGADEAATEAFFVHVYVDRATRRPKPLGEDFRQVVEGLVKSPR
ncbi:thioesterase family protein [Hyphobacterium sp. Y6023]|uniref:Thioesterase family protein n=1 Tax=Hyphobacterium marinum TaxID=3116574 RepID=A0ABU7LVD7_9PROT|nr:thioesterase family protein [Hyphobacterium sp. Y6023]MEE2565505.1 thioesterase family protein [Hyphobacterium sp. Y6023]